LQKAKIFIEQTVAAWNDVTAKTIVCALFQNLRAVVFNLFYAATHFTTQFNL